MHPPPLVPSMCPLVLPGDLIHVVADVMVVADRCRYTFEDFDATGEVVFVGEGSFTLRTMTPVHHRHILIDILYPAIHELEIL